MKRTEHVIIAVLTVCLLLLVACTSSSSTESAPLAQPTESLLVITNPVIVITVTNSVYLTDASQFDPLNMEPGQDDVKFRAFVRESKDFFQRDWLWSWSNNSVGISLERDWVKAWAIPASVSNWQEEMICKWDHYVYFGSALTESNSNQYDAWKAGNCENVHVAALNGDYIHATHAIYLTGDLNAGPRLGSSNFYFTEIWYRTDQINR